ncbi:MAG: 16S rRNA (cytidine(1402)-2'-O)-methyltransferase [Pseudomonadota bacterium]
MNYKNVSLPAGLYLVGVPIGTARDITLRALDVLASADVLAAEDTRSLRKLMDIHGVPLAGRKIVAVHEHSGAGVIARLVEAVSAGKAVAYASEAGMPMVADPGFELARAVAADGFSVTSAPGPSAAVTALVLAGLPTDAFFFAGFLPSAQAARGRALEKLAQVPGTLIFYESPKRLGAMLAQAALVLGDMREAAVCRELTKKFEEVARGTLASLAEVYAGRGVKGEIVVLIERASSETVKEEDINRALTKALETMSVRDAAEMVAKAHDLPRRKVYQTALSLAQSE